MLAVPAVVATAAAVVAVAVATDAAALAVPAIEADAIDCTTALKQ